MIDPDGIWSPEPPLEFAVATRFPSTAEAPNMACELLQPGASNNAATTAIPICHADFVMF
jgi:hypothetical protein